MATLLFECFSEEMPARMQRGARDQLEQLLTKALAAGNITHGAVRTFASPRHLAITIEDLPELQPDVTIEKKGPKVGAPQAAIDGFLKSTGLASLDACEQRTVGKDTVYFATTTTRGRPMTEWLKDALEQLMRDFTWPKSMRWGAHSIQWVRPLHRITALLDSTIIPVQFGHITASNITEGHRFLAPAPITLAHASDYESALAAAHVMVNADARRNAIHNAATTAAAEAGLTLVEDAGLLDEVTGLVESPFCYVGTFEEAFMHLPREVLTSEMRHHQKYFALQKPTGELSHHFIITANMKATDGGNAIKHGNARVLRARLADGEFYWNQDKNTPLTQWAEKLRDVVFHAKVGMMNEKVERIEQLAGQLTSYVANAPIQDVLRAAKLCKADLTTGMVGEFPELQGIMGRYYATQQGESQPVADAIRDHYKPVGASDDVPTDPITICVALADKLDSIISLFAAGEKPTGSKDPLALRRAALGVIRIIWKDGYNIDLHDLGATDEVIAFFRERLVSLLRDDGISHDIISACLAVSGKGLNISVLTQNCHRLQKWLATDEGKVFLGSIKRALNILASEERKTKTELSPLRLKLSEPAERALADAVYGWSEYSRLNALEMLSKPINVFFDDLHINEEGKKEARLGLLAELRDITRKYADFSLVEAN